AVQWPGAGVSCKATRISGITIIFQTPGAQPALTATSSLSGTSPTISVTTMSVGDATANAVQMLTFGGTVSGGSFTLKLGANTTGAITWNANPASLAQSVQAALAAGPTSTQTTVRPWAQAIRVIASVPNFPDAVLKFSYPAGTLQDASGPMGFEEV